jgi:hypothetical protein
MTRVDDVLRMATSAGVTVQVEGSNLVLEYDADPPANLVGMLRRFKPELVSALRTRQAEQRSLIVQWINDHFVPSPPGVCGHCGGDERSEDPFVVLFVGNERGDLHASCHANVACSAGGRGAQSPGDRRMTTAVEWLGTNPPTKTEHGKQLDHQDGEGDKPMTELELVYLGRVHDVVIEPHHPKFDLDHVFVHEHLRASGRFPEYAQVCAENCLIVAMATFGAEPVGLSARLAIFALDDISFGALLLGDGRIVEIGDRKRGFHMTDSPDRADEMKALVAATERRVVTTNLEQDFAAKDPPDASIVAQGKEGRGGDMTKVEGFDLTLAAELAHEVCTILHQRTGKRRSKKREREWVKILLSSGSTLKGVNPNDLQAQGWQITKVRNTREMARDIVEKMLAEPEGAWTSCASIDGVLRQSVDGKVLIGPVEPDAARFKIAVRVAGGLKFVRCNATDKAGAEDMRRKLVEGLKAAGAKLLFWPGDASIFEAAAEACLWNDEMSDVRRGRAH